MRHPCRDTQGGGRVSGPYTVVERSRTFYQVVKEGVLGGRRVRATYQSATAAAERCEALNTAWGKEHEGDMSSGGQ